MGLRFRRSIKIAPGVKFNINKNSVGMSFGTKGAHYTVNSKGKKTASVGIPGTGLSYTQSTGGGSSKSGSPKGGGSSNKGGGCLITCLKVLGIIILIPFVLILGWIAGIIWFIFYRGKITDEQKQKKYTILIAIGSAISLLIFIVNMATPKNSEDTSIYTEPTEIVTEATETQQTESQVMESEIIEETETELVESEAQAERETESTETSTSESAEPVESTSQQSDSTPAVVAAPEQETQPEQKSEPQTVEDATAQTTSDQPEMVWVDDTAKRYHRKQDCSGMDNAYQVTKEQAESMNKTPCGRCYK